jgi:hypothetical protein
MYIDNHFHLSKIELYIIFYAVIPKIQITGNFRNILRDMNDFAQKAGENVLLNMYTYIV